MSSVTACLVHGQLGNCNRVRDQFHRAAQVERSDNDRATARAALQEAADARYEHGKPQAGPGPVRVKRAELDRVLVRAWILLPRIRRCPVTRQVVTEAARLRWSDPPDVACGMRNVLGTSPPCSLLIRGRGFRRKLAWGRREHRRPRC